MGRSNSQVGQRMSGLSCPELMAVSSTLSKAGSEQTDLEGEREAWTVVMRETSRCHGEEDGGMVMGMNLTGLDVRKTWENMLGDICNMEDSLGLLLDIA